jgi:TP901 family phage tail tape measure protein
MAIGGKSVMELLINVRDNSRGAFNRVGAQIRGVKKDTKGLNKGLGVFRSTLGSLPGPAGRLVGALGPLGIAGAAIAATAAIGFFAASAVKSFTAFEDSMANVRKTTGMTKEETIALGGAIDGMALRLPVAHEELAKIAAIAGQLGIQGKTSILGFTEDIAKMSTAFDMSAEDTATAMAKMANIYDIPLEQISNMGSAINTLGNTTAASESQLMDFGMSLGPTGKQLGFTFEQTMALGASMIEMGVNSSDAGTRLNRAFSKIGQNIDEVAKFMGVSADEFRNSFENMPMETFTEILQKLSAVEGNLKANTIGAELFGEVGAKSIKAIIGNLDGLETNLSTVTTGFKENTSLTEEFAAKTDTLKAKFALVGNAAESLKINIGQALAPMAGILAEGVSKGISGISKAFDVMQKVAGPVLDLLFLRFHILKAFLEGLFTPIMGALAPLSSLFEGTGTAVTKLNIGLEVMKDVFTIITGVARKLGTILGTLLAKAITPLVAKIKEGIATLKEFYDKLGPIKGLIEGVKDKVGAGAAAIGEWADSFEKVVPPVEELSDAITELGEEAKKVGPVLTESIKTLGSRLTEVSGSYKAAISDITKEIDTLKDAWNLASDDQKRAIEKQIEALVGVRDELKHGEEEADKYFDTHKKGTEEATKKQEEFTVKLGETTVTFKGVVAEVIKNADAYTDLQKNAETLLDLDWSVFATLEAELPNIDAGIGNMSSTFVGLKGILDENIGELEAVKTSVIEISEIAAPFLEKGFLNGIKAIGDFAGALSDAGSAINTFGNLQEVSVEGCIDFSLHVNDMVSALQILDNQMDDMVPTFKRMGELTASITKSFLGETFIEETTKQLSRFGNKLEDIKYKAGSWDVDPWGVRGYAGTKELLIAMGATETAANELMKSIGSELRTEIIQLGLESGNSAEFIDKLSKSTLIMNACLEISTGKFKAQTTQLSKITDALAPYLNFMRTLNELAALSALSTDELNRGLDAISDTLMNLSKALSTFDLEPTMQALFGSGTKGEGSAKAFTDTMLKYASDFNTLVNYIEKLSTAIITLTSAFDGLENINKSVLADETALIALFGDITDIMENFSNTMDKSGFGNKLAAGIEKMVSSASPLTTYFKDNNAAVTQFNNTLSAFKSVLGSVVDTMERLLEMTTMTVPEVTELAAGFDKAAEFVRTFDEALMMHVGAKEGPWDMEKYFNSVFNSIKDLASSWKMLTYDMGDSFETFEKAISTITGIIGNITSLTTAFADMKDIVIPDAIAMEAALSKIPTVIKDMTELLGKKTWTDISANIAAFALEWDAISEGISDAIDSFSSFIGILNKIISACTEMTRIFTDMGEIVVIESDEIAEALKDIPAVMAKVTEYLTTDSFKAIKGGLIDLNTEYKKHSKVLDEVMPSYDSAINMFSSLANNVMSLSKSFEELKDATIISSIDMDKAMQNIDTFVNRFVDALALNLDNLVDSLIDLDAEWAKHADEMKVVMPSYETATKDIGTLISSITSLGSALLSLSEMGVITSTKFDTGFSALITSVANFAVSLRNNVVPLIDSLQLLRKAWIENEVVLVPLMLDFRMITKSFAMLAYNANQMTAAFTQLAENSGSLEKGFDSLIGFIGKVVKSTKEFYTPETAASIKQYVVDIGLVISAFRYLAEQLEGATSDIEKEISTTVNNISETVLSLKSLLPHMSQYGATLMFNFISGINAWIPVLEAQLIGIANMIKAYLGVSSPTELGALKDIEAWPKNLIRSFASGIKSEMSTLNNSFSGMTLGAPGGGGGGNVTHVTFHVTQNIADKATAEYSTRELERMINRHEIL